MVYFQGITLQAQYATLTGAPSKAAPATNVCATLGHNIIIIIIVIQKVQYPHVDYIVNNRHELMSLKAYFHHSYIVHIPKPKQLLQRLFSKSGVFHQLCAPCGF